MSNYDDLYRKGGFKYTTTFGVNHIQRLQNVYNCFTPNMRILDAPCGNGFWSRILRKMYGAHVTPSDISPVGATKANGTIHDLEIRKPEWDRQFDLVFCRGLSHFHHKDFLGNRLFTVIDNLSNYAPYVLIIYATSQTNKAVPGHYHHTRRSLDNQFKWIGTFKSRMIKGYYTALLDFTGIESDIP